MDTTTSTTGTTLPRSGYDAVGGIVFLPRMLDKVRLHAAGRLPADYNLGTGLDARLCRFLGVEYAAVAAVSRAEPDDERVLAWCFAQGHKPSEDDIRYFNAFMTKRGWRDDASTKLAASKEKRGLSGRDEIQTTFDLQDVEEGRSPAGG